MHCAHTYVFVFGTEKEMVRLASCADACSHAFVSDYTGTMLFLAESPDSQWMKSKLVQ